MARPNQQAFLRVPHEVRFAGMQSDTYRLQRAGWSVVETVEYYDDAVSLTRKHATFDIVMQTNNIRVNREYIMQGHAHRFEIVRIGPTNKIQVFQSFSEGHLVDCTPVMSTIESLYSDWALFGEPVAKTLEVLVEPSSVSECLDLIQKLQSPKLAAIRAEGRERDLRTAYTQHINAKIMSVA